MYSAEERAVIIAAVAARLRTGEPLAAICRGDGMPNDDTIRNWMDEDSSVSRVIARAREAGEDSIAADCLTIADDLTDDPASRRVRTETRLKLLAKWNPKRWGDKLDLNHSGSIQNETAEHLDARIAQLLGKARAGDAAGGEGSPDAPDGA